MCASEHAGSGMQVRRATPYTHKTFRITLDCLCHMAVECLVIVHPWQLAHGQQYDARLAVQWWRGLGEERNET